MNPTDLIPKKLAPYKLPYCWNCYDLGNYEIALMSDGVKVIKWKFGEFKTIDKGKEYCENHGTTEEELYRVQCESCHPRFVKRHEELTSVILSEKSNIKEKSEAKDELSVIWGLKPKRKLNA